MVGYSHLFQNFPQFIVIHTVKGFGIVNKAGIDGNFFALIAEEGFLMSPCYSLELCIQMFVSFLLMLKILQARLQQYVNHELPDVQAGFRKGREPEIKLPTSAGSLKKQGSSRKTSIFALLTMPKLLTV